MTIAEQLIHSVCIHEAAHFTCAFCLGAASADLSIDVFGLCNGQGNSVQFVSEFVPPEFRAIINCAGEVGECITDCHAVAMKHPLAWQALNGNKLPSPGQRAKPLISGDAMNFVANLLEVKPPNPTAFLQLCQQRASQILTDQWTSFMETTRFLEARAAENKISDRLPTDGIPGDGDHHFQRIGNRPLITTLREYLDQWIELAPEAQIYRR